MGRGARQYSLIDDYCKIEDCIGRCICYTFEALCSLSKLSILPCVCCLSCLWTLGEANGESGGTGDGDSDTGSPRELSEDPLG